ncbi:MAG: cation-transporting P-type ATPase [Phycisphaerales bacterium]|nr:cation-transporting P-type ATPase [Phycisphaerales bacterium]
MREPTSSTAWHALDVQSALERLRSGPDGLSAEEAARRLDHHGPNRLRPPQRLSPLARLLLQFHNVLIYVLIGAGVATALLDHWIDTGVIFGVVIVNALIGFFQEGKAERALEAISQMLSLEATVVRGGRRESIPADQIVPGDVVVLRSGDKVPADLRLTEARELRIDEAMLTGESVPAEKSTEALAENTALGDRSCLAFSGTLVMTGQGTGVVTATGDHTELGRISQMVSQTTAVTTPLIRQMNRFGHVLAVVVVVVAAVTFAAGYLVGGTELMDLFLAAVALAVAAIPEGLPAIMTIVLAIGVQRMARRHAIIRRLPAVDTLGALTVICSDKTGTLTRNEMTVTAIVTAGGPYEATGVGYAPQGEILADGRTTDLKPESALGRLLRAGALCNDSNLVQEADQWRPAGDPMEGALLTLAMKAGLAADELRSAWPTIDAVPFDSTHKFMATLHRAPQGEQALVLVKGAPERIVEMCTRQALDDAEADLDAAYWQEQERKMAGRGQRVLALACKPADPGQDKLDFDHVQTGLTLLGLVGIIDPPREEAIAAVKQCHEAGIRVVMITGDHALTAQAIGRQLDIGDGTRALTGADLDALDDAGLAQVVADCDVYARVSPEHKLRLVTAIQSRGQVVAMTGDGVNDAPALKRADVGIAMGIKGTEVTKEAAAMVLTDDNFASIAHAVEEGRTVYDNLRKAILFILPTNGGEALTVLLAILLGRTLPLTPVQVLWVNMVTAVTLALALAFEPPEADVMKRPPRDPKAHLLSRYFLWRIALVSVVMCAGTFGVFVWMRAQGASLEVARTMAVGVIVLFEAFYLLSTRFILAPVLSLRGLLGSRPVLLAIVLVVGFQLLFTYAPVMQRLFGTAPIDWAAWALLAAVASSVLWIVEFEKWVVRRWAGGAAGR